MKLLEIHTFCVPYLYWLRAQNVRSILTCTPPPRPLVWDTYGPGAPSRASLGPPFGRLPRIRSCQLYCDTRCRSSRSIECPTGASLIRRANHLRLAIPSSYEDVSFSDWSNHTGSSYTLSIFPRISWWYVRMIPSFLGLLRLAFKSNTILVLLLKLLFQKVRIKSNTKIVLLLKAVFLKVIPKVRIKMSYFKKQCF